MTNTYGAELRDDEEGAGGHVSVTEEDDVVSEPPSDSEFDDVVADDVDADMEGDLSEGGASEPAVARRSAFLPIAAAVGGVFLIGSLAWWQFSSASSGARSMPVMISKPQTSAAPADNSSLAALGIEAEPEGAPVDQKTSSAVVDIAPAPVASVPVVEPQVIPAPVVSPQALSADVGAVQVAAVDSAPVSAAVPAVVAVPVSSSSPVMVAKETVPAPVEIKPVADARAEALTARVDELQKALDKANQQIEHMNNALAAAATPESSKKEMQDQIDRLQKQVASLTTKSSEKPREKAPVVETKPVVAVEESSMVSNNVASKPAKVVRKTAKKSPAVVKQAAVKPVKKPVREEDVAEVKWILRAAAPGQAWVSPGAGSRDLKKVQVGDTLAGVGRITAIQQNGDAWVIKGAKGTIQ